MTAAVLCPSPRSRSYHEAATKQLASNHDKYAKCALNACHAACALNSIPEVLDVYQKGQNPVITKLEKIAKRNCMNGQKID